MKLVDKVKDYLDERSKEIAFEFTHWIISDLEEYENIDRAILSPVEQLFYIEYYNHYYRAFYREELRFLLEPQFNSDKLTGKYTLDFCVDFLGYLINADYGSRFSENSIQQIDFPLLGIEIDSHIWHEKTKEQVQYHKKRERFLISKGWKLLRFTGSEIYKDPAKCFEEVKEIANNMALDWHIKLKDFDKKGDKT